MRLAAFLVLLIFAMLSASVSGARDANSGPAEVRQAAAADY